MAAILEILKQIGKSVLVSIVTESFLKELIITALEKLAQKTDNKVDDVIVEKIKQALYPSEQK